MVLLITSLGTGFSGILINIDTFWLGNCIWKCRLQNVGQLISTSMCLQGILIADISYGVFDPDNMV